jgi:predicted transcriptional regulator
LQEQLEKLAFECESTPSELAQRAIEDYVAYTRQLATELREAEEEAEREGWVPQEEVFAQLFADLRKSA